MRRSSISGSRPRVQGDRELEILNATLDLLADVGYDRLTMDAVATRGRVSKATLYRRWKGKVGLVMGALIVLDSSHSTPDSGTLRGDLIEVSRDVWSLTDDRHFAIVASVITAVARDSELGAAFRQQMIDPRAACGLEILERARLRGEISQDIDLALVNSALPAIVLNHRLLHGQPPSIEQITLVVDHILLPALRSAHPSTNANDSVAITTTPPCLHATPTVFGHA